jgi:hypothetical protein
VCVCCIFDAEAQTGLTGEITDKNGRAIAGVLVDFNNGLIRTFCVHGRFYYA